MRPFFINEHYFGYGLSVFFALLRDASSMQDNQSLQVIQPVRHLAIIMDGNGRWATQRGLPRIVGHQRGVETVLDIVEECQRIGVEALTLYAFSSENWGRPQEEINALMCLLVEFLASQRKHMLEKGMRFRVIGDVSKMPEPVQNSLASVQAETAAGTGMTLVLALSYGARDEIIRTIRSLSDSLCDGSLTKEQITEDYFSACLDSKGLPDLDLLIRTSGEVRISNFMLWQLAYAELYFTDVLWPDFSRKDLHAALCDFHQRRRRFGLTDDQCHQE